MQKLFYTFLLLIFAVNSFSQPKDSGIFVDKEGIIRWEKDKTEALFFGVNYSAPFVFGFRHIKATGIPLEEAIQNDVYHLSRIGVNAFRIHVFDTEITDSVGNILDNEHLRLFDFLIAELKKRNIKILLTPIAYWGNGYPEKDISTGSFSFKYGKKEALVNHIAWQAQENYLKQFFSRKNRYTGLTYQQDVDIIATEVNNEPQHTGNKQEVTNYVNKMVNAIRSTGWKKPVFYNISESPTYADAVVKANVQGHTFQWYPTGLVANRTQKGNLLPNVSKYTIPFDTIPAFTKRAKIVYEFDAADVYDSYMYPAMAKSFRKAGFQWATMFAYDPMAIANVNTEYQTHYLNLAYTPSKAISLLIAAKAFKEVNSTTKVKSDSVFANIHLKPSLSLSEYLTDKSFFYSNSTTTEVFDTPKLENISGVGSSNIIKYKGTGAYFLDKIKDGVWRLELMPDAVSIKDPFEKASPKKEVTSIVWKNHDFKITLDNLGEDFNITGINTGNSFNATAQNGIVNLLPGTYILKRQNVTYTVKEKDNFGLIAMNDFVAPRPKNVELNLYHQQLPTISESSSPILNATVVGLNDSDKLWVYFHHLAGKWDKVQMNKVSDYNFEIIVPKSLLQKGILEYRIVVESSKVNYTFPGKVLGNPYDWDFYNKEAYVVNIVSKNDGLNLFNADFNRNEINYYNPDWMNYKNSFVLNDMQKIALKSTMQKANGKDFMGWQHFVFEKIISRKSDLNSFSELVVNGKSAINKPINAKVAVISKSGKSYIANFVLPAKETSIKINLNDLIEQDMLLLPRPYPGFLPLYYKSNSLSIFKLEDIEKIEFTFGYDLQKDLIDKEVSVEISDIFLQ